MEADGRMAMLPKKEQILLHKELAQAADQPQWHPQHEEGARRHLRHRHQPRGSIAIHEAHRLDIPVVGTLDTNCDPDDVDYGIPANDDAIRSVRLLADFVADAVIAGVGAE